MPRLPRAAVGRSWFIACVAVLFLVAGGRAHAQEPPPAYLAVVEGVATLERGGESEPAVRDMPFVPGDRLRTEAGRVEIQFPDGTAIEVAEYSLVEAVTPSRVRLLAGTMDHLQPTMDAAPPVSAAYLPQDLQTYSSTFDRYGSWEYSAPYGYVWYPTVASEWRPYYYGNWSAVPSYGWTWIGLDAWSYPTHHYGRWGYGRNAWFWIPGRTWSAAWVSWGAAPDYVSWCPLGYDGRPVFGLSDAAGRYRGGADRGGYGWTVMSRNRFGVRGSYAHRNAIEPRTLPANTPFIVQSRPPVALPHAAARASAPGAAAGVAVPREYGRPQPDVRLPHNSQRPVQNQQPANEQPAPNDQRSDQRSFGAPRRAYPIEAPRAGETPRATPESPRIYPHAVPRAAAPAAAGPAAPGPAAPAPPAAAQYGSSPAGSRVPQAGYRQAEPQRSSPPPTAMPRISPPPPQRAPAPAPPPAAASAPAAAPATPAPAPPSRATPPARSAPEGAAREGTARERSGGDGSSAGARRRR